MNDPSLISSNVLLYYVVDYPSVALPPQVGVPVASPAAPMYQFDNTGTEVHSRPSSFAHEYEDFAHDQSSHEVKQEGPIMRELPTIVSTQRSRALTHSDPFDAEHSQSALARTVIIESSPKGNTIEALASGSGAPTRSPEDFDGYSRVHTPMVHDRVGIYVDQGERKMNVDLDTHTRDRTRTQVVPHTQARTEVEGVVDADVDNDFGAGEDGESTYELGDHTESETEVSDSASDGGDEGDSSDDGSKGEDGSPQEEVATDN